MGCVDDELDQRILVDTQFPSRELGIGNEGTNLFRDLAGLLTFSVIVLCAQTAGALLFLHDGGDLLAYCFSLA